MNSTTNNNQRPSPDKALSQAVGRLSDRVGVSQRRLGTRLSSLDEAHGLKASELWDSQRQISKLIALGSAPTPSEFWADTAEPWAAVLTTASISAIDEELPSLRSAIARFTESIAIANSKGASISNATMRSMLADHLADPMVRVRPSSKTLDELGAVWHSRLRRSAWRKTFPAALFRSAVESDLRIAQAQVDLASVGPWAHGDRLLSAFEGAHADIREYLDDQLAQITTVKPAGLPVHA